MNKSELTTVIGFTVIMVTVLVLYSRYYQQPLSPAGAQVGSVAPEITATGWVNGVAPTQAELQGKIVVVEAWATWCLPCRVHAPELVKVYNKFKDEEVIFLGLTAESEDQLPAINAFLDDTKIEWRNGYGAEQTLTALEAEYIPSTWVIDRDGTICWNSNSRQTLEDFLEDKLSQPEPQSKL